VSALVYGNKERERGKKWRTGKVTAARGNR